LLVTASVWGWVEDNDYLAMSCGCKGTPSNSIWTSQLINNLRPDDDDRYGRVLSAKWCDDCGKEFCNAILDGRIDREDVSEARTSLLSILSRDIYESAVRKKKREIANTKKGLRKIR